MPKLAHASDARRGFLWVILAVLAVVGAALPAWAQRGIAVDLPFNDGWGNDVNDMFPGRPPQNNEAGGRNKLKPSFTMPNQSTQIKDSLEEFERFIQHESWERAFKLLETINPQTATGFVDRGDGVLMPSRLLVRSMLAKLPPAGKKAYRVFYDPAANQLWNTAEGKAEAENLTAISNQYMICSVGDKAADRLGDMYYERGDLEQAIAAWQSLITYCPESQIPRAQTYSKMATAMARLGRWNEFREIQRTISERYADEIVQYAGKKAAAGTLIADLAKSENRNTSGMALTAMPQDFDFPTSDEPLWQFRFQTRPDPLNPQNPMLAIEIPGRPRATDFAIPVTVDAQRVYVDQFGVAMAFDLATGKLQWRTTTIGQTPNLPRNPNPNQNQQQLIQRALVVRSGAPPERFSINVQGDRLWCVTRDPNQNQQPQAPFSLVIRSTADGHEINNRRALAAWNILGTPLLTGDKAFVGAIRAMTGGGNNPSQGRELSLLMLDANDGKLLKSISLGLYSTDQNQIYSERISEPTFLLHRDRLYVETNGGAVLAVHPGTGAVEWAVQYDFPPMNQGYPDYGLLSGVGAPVYNGGLLFSKGMRSPRLLAMRPDNPAPLWNRPVPSASKIVGSDQDRVYLSGGELNAIDLKTQDIAWHARLPLAASWSEPYLTENRIYQFTSRGVFSIDKRTGEGVKIFRGADAESLGGRIFITPEYFVTVSNAAISVYPLGAKTDVAGGSQ